MTPASSFLVLGSEYNKPNITKTFSLAQDLAAALSPGRRAGFRRKLDGNEDAMGVIPLKGGQLLLMADSHFGNTAGHLAVTGFERYFRSRRGNPVRKMFSAHLALDRWIREQKLREPRVHPGCATTLLSAFVSGKTLQYCNWGDSRLFLVRGGRLKVLNEAHEDYFLGEAFSRLDQLRRLLELHECIDQLTKNERLDEIAFLLTVIFRQVRGGSADLATIEAAVEAIETLSGIPFSIDLDELLREWHPLHMGIAGSLPTWGELVLRPGDCLCMASDGIDEEVSGCSLEELEQVLGAVEVPLVERAETLLARCMGKKGGNDNLMVLLKQV